MKKLEIKSKLTESMSPSLAEPFSSGRATPRLLFDFSAMLSLLYFNQSLPVLDFGAGTGWASEILAKMGFDVTAFDIHGNLESLLLSRCEADIRIDPKYISFAHGDGHNMPFSDNLFGNILCFDTLHHMHDYQRFFHELRRVLAINGRAIFVEPGSRHSNSPETVAFVNAQKLHDPTWIERDVVLDEINSISISAGFDLGIQVCPLPHPLALKIFNYADYSKFRKSNFLKKSKVREEYCDYLSKINYEDRVIFYVERIK